MNVTKTITHREQFGYWLNDNGILEPGAEIGSAFGQFASRIMSQWHGHHLYMVDPWENLPEGEYREAHAGVNYEEWYQRCQHLAATDERVSLIRMRSADASMQIAPMSLGWVYIDGNHDYGFVMNDMDLWFPKLIPGGILCGHDFYDNFEGGNFCGVASAVIRWMKEHGMAFTVTPCTSWWAIKE